MKRVIIILCAVVLYGAMQAKDNEDLRLTVYIEEGEGESVAEDDKVAVSEKPHKIIFFDGTIVLEMSRGVDFACIGLHLLDENTNSGFGTYMELKRRDDFFLLEAGGKQYFTIEEAIEDYLRDLLYSTFEDEEYRERVWSSFVNDGGLEIFIDTARGFIDDEFLDSPFNEIYG